jgi:hypothetical protein
MTGGSAGSGIPGSGAGVGGPGSGAGTGGPGSGRGVGGAGSGDGTDSTCVLEVLSGSFMTTPVLAAIGVSETATLAGYSEIPSCGTRIPASRT